MKTSVTTSDSKWYSEWQRVVQQMKSGTMSDNEWQRVTASAKINENSTAHFKEWMIVILSMTTTDTLL